MREKKRKKGERESERGWGEKKIKKKKKGRKASHC